MPHRKSQKRYKKRNKKWVKCIKNNFHFTFHNASFLFSYFFVCSLLFFFLQIPRSLAGWLHSRTIVQCLGVAVWIENRLEAGRHLGRWAAPAAGELEHIYIYIYWYLWKYGCICVCVHIHIYEILKGSSCATFWSRLVKAISFQTCLKRVKFSLFMCAACLDGCDVSPFWKKKTQRAVTNMHFLLVSLSDWPFAVDEYSVTRQRDSCTCSPVLRDPGYPSCLIFS